MVTYTLTWEVYGAEGHRQGESFNPSTDYDFSCEYDGIRRIVTNNSDRTGTNEYSQVRITRNTYIECIDEFEGQLWDGIFENYRVGKRVLTGVEETKYFEKNGRYYKQSYYQKLPSEDWIESAPHRIRKEVYMNVLKYAYAEDLWDEGDSDED